MTTFNINYKCRTNMVSSIPQTPCSHSPILSSWRANSKITKKSWKIKNWRWGCKDKKWWFRKRYCRDRLRKIASSSRWRWWSWSIRFNRRLLRKSSKNMKVWDKDFKEIKSTLLKKSLVSHVRLRKLTRWSCIGNMRRGKEAVKRRRLMRW